MSLNILMLRSCAIKYVLTKTKAPILTQQNGQLL